MDLEVRQALREVELVGKQHELFLALIDKLSDIELLTNAIEKARAKLLALRTVEIEIKDKGPVPVIGQPQRHSKYSDLLTTASSLELGRGFVVESVDGRTGKDLFRRLGPFVRRHSLRGNPNGALVLRIDQQDRVIISCVDRASVNPPRKRPPPGYFSEEMRRARGEL